jgi:cysteine desulfurase family protein
MDCLLHTKRCNASFAQAAVLRNPREPYSSDKESGTALLLVGSANCGMRCKMRREVSAYDVISVGVDGTVMIYLDNAATTLRKPTTVGIAMQYALTHAASAGRSAHSAALLAAKILFDTRSIAAQLFDVADASRVIFTTNATDALNTAIFSMGEHGNRFAVTGMEHNAVIRPMYQLCQQGKQAEILSTPLWNPDRLLEQIQKKCSEGLDCLVVNHVSNVYGYCLPLEEIDALLADYGAAMIVDASQSAGICPISCGNLRSAVAVCMPGHKGLYGPQGTGLLLALTDDIRKPHNYGGTGSNSIERDMPEELPDRLEAGTHNITGIAGLFEGIRFVRQLGTESILHHERILRKQLAAMLRKLPQITCYESPEESLQTGVLSITCQTMSCEQLAEALAERGIGVRAGLHCAPVAHQTGGTLESGTVRFSPGWFQNTQQIKQTAEAIEMILSNC